MITNCDMTIYNRKLNPETRKYVFARTVLENVHWHAEQKTNIGENGLVSADIIKVRIPLDNRRGYIPPERYKLLLYEEQFEYWTVENGDVLIQGIAIVEAEKESDIIKLGGVKVISHSVNLYGASPHIRIGGSL